MLLSDSDEATEAEILSPDQAGMASLLQDCIFALSESRLTHFVVVRKGLASAEKVFRSITWIYDEQDRHLTQLETLVLDAAEKISTVVMAYLSRPRAYHGSVSHRWPCPRLKRLVIRTEDFTGEAELAALIARRHEAALGLRETPGGEVPCALLDISFPYWEPEKGMAVALSIARASGCRFFRYPRGDSQGVGFKLLSPDEGEESIRSLLGMGFREILFI